MSCCHNSGIVDNLLAFHISDTRFKFSVWNVTPYSGLSVPDSFQCRNITRLLSFIPSQIHVKPKSFSQYTMNSLDIYLSLCIAFLHHNLKTHQHTPMHTPLPPPPPQKKKKKKKNVRESLDYSFTCPSTARVTLGQVLSIAT